MRILYLLLLFLSCLTTSISAEEGHLLKKIRVIVNPIAGGKNKEKIVEKIKQGLDPKKFSVEILYTKGPFHAKELAEEAINNGVEIVAAVGGDGTINEIAQALVGSKAALAIIPVGSGNGLARHLRLPLNVSRAVEIINKGRAEWIDAVSINEKYYLGVAGIGFDAEIGWKFAQLRSRGVFSYIVAVIKSFPSYHSSHFELTVDGQKIAREAFLISFANSSQFGNGVIIAPTARINDGLVDVVILNKFPVAATAKIAYQLFHPKLARSKYVEIIQCKEVDIDQPNLHAHIDGEPVFFEKGLHLKILPSSVRVIVN